MTTREGIVTIQRRDKTKKSKRGPAYRLTGGPGYGRKGVRIGIGAGSGEWV